MSARLRLGLQAKISGAIVAAVLLTAAVSMLLALVIARGALRAEVIEATQDAAQAYATAVSLYLANAREILEVSATRPTVRDAVTASAAPPTSKADSARPILAGIARQAPEFDYLLLLDASGRVLATAPAELEATQLRPDRGFSAWFQQLVRERRTVVSDLVLSVTTQRPTVIVAAPVLDGQNQVLGALAGGLKLAELSKVGEFTNRPTERYGFLTDRRGLVIAHQRQPDYVLYQTDLTAVEPVRAALAGAAGAGRFYNPVERSEQFAAWLPMPGTPWAVVQVQPVASAFAPLDRLTRALGLAAVFVALILGGLAFGYVRPIVEALRELAARAERISTGGEGGGTLVTARPDELGHLTDAFNRMTAALASKDEALRARLDELARANRSLEQVNDAKDQFLAMLGHELRNPLGAISSAVQILGVVGQPDERTTRPREVIARQVRHLTRLVDDLLNASRVASGKVVLVPEPVDLGACVTRVLATLRASGRLDRHAVEHDVTPVWVDADETRLEQIVTNLVTNALKYTPAGGHIRVTVAAQDGVATLRVSDDGVGIAAELLPRVFDLFVQGQGGLDRSSGGLGLGLTVVRRLVELHGGTVEAASEGSRRGATFTVRLPRIPAPAARAAQPPPPPVAAARRRVLIVEDNEDAREMLRTTLELAGHDVQVAPDGASGVTTALAFLPEVALIDVGFDGYEVARRIRAAAPGQSIRLVAVTGYGQPEDRRRAEAAGFDAHLVKPVDEALLAEALGPRAAETADTHPDHSREPV